MANDIYCSTCGKIFPNIGLLTIHNKIHIRESIYRNTISEPTDLFIKNKYTKWYYNIINLARTKNHTGYTERHHIIPKSIGGSDNDDNLIILSAKEHFICHFLLTKMIPSTSSSYHKMIHAFIFMKAENSNHYRYMNSSLYDSIKEKYSIIRSEMSKSSNNSQYGTMWVSNFKEKCSIKILCSDISSYLEKGWSKGRCMNFNKYDEEGNKIITEKSIKKNNRKSNKLKEQKIKEKKIIDKDPSLLPKRKTSAIRMVRKVLNKPLDYEVKWSDYYQVRDILYEDLHIRNLSPTKINQKYSFDFKYPSAHISTSFGLNLKNLKESVNNYYQSLKKGED